MGRPRRRILITGVSGVVGRLLHDGLADAYALRGLDVENDDRVGFHASMTELSTVQAAFEGQDTVIDLAASSDFRSPWPVVQGNNLPATYNALEASRRAGVRRMIYASSNHVTGMYERDPPYSAIVAGDYEGLDPLSFPRIDVRAPMRPDGPYGLGKAFGELAARYYSEEFGLSVICLRIGHVNGDSRPHNSRHFSTLLTARDLVHLVEQCIEAPEDLRFATYYGVSNNTWRIWDIDDARAAIAFHPKDNAEVWR